MNEFIINIISEKKYYTFIEKESCKEYVQRIIDDINNNKMVLLGERYIKPSTIKEVYVQDFNNKLIRINQL